MADEQPKKCLTPKARLSFPAIWEPAVRIDDKTGEKTTTFEATLLFPKGTDLTPLKRLVYAAVVKKWGAEKSQWPPVFRQDWKTYLSTTGKDGWPFRDGDYQDYDGYPGQISVKTKSKIRPPVFDGGRAPIVDPNMLYAGCYVHAVISAYAWHHMKTNNKGVSFTLLGLQKHSDGEPFGVKADANDFQELNDSADASAYAGEDEPF